MGTADLDELTNLLGRAYRIPVARIDPIQSGTATDNYVVTSTHGPRLFAKVYRDQDLDTEVAAIEVAEFVRTGGGVPVPRVHRSTDGHTIARLGDTAVSVWDFVDDAETAEGGLLGERWANVGSVVGRLHRRLREYPGTRPERRPASGLGDYRAVREGYDALIADYQTLARPTELEVWAWQALRQRRALLPVVDRILDRLPALTVQVVHGDLAAPNLLLRGDEVAAVIDFQPPTPRFLAWEIARIACDPRTVTLDGGWPAGVAVFVDRYRQQNTTVAGDDLDAVVAIGCAYTIFSTYPLGELIENRGRVTTSLIEYARARHDAALRMLEVLQP